MVCKLNQSVAASSGKAVAGSAPHPPAWNATKFFQLIKGRTCVMASILSREEGTHWRGRQKFRLTANGTEAEAQYQLALKSSRELGGRAALDGALERWASALGVRPGDGVYLSELRASVRTLAEIVEGLEPCGITKGEAKEALGRLVNSNFAELVLQ